MDTSNQARGKDVQVEGKKKLAVVASLAAAPLIGGAAGVAVAALPAVATPAPAAAHVTTVSAHGATSTGHTTARAGSAKAQSPATDPDENQTEATGPDENQTETDGPGGHQDTGASINHQFEGVE
jgi:hypothetical protein